MANARIADLGLDASNAPYGLAPMQTGMLFQSLLEEGAGAGGYDIEQIHVALDEKISLPRFARAWATVVRRHPALSSSFQWKGVAEARQYPNPAVVVPMETEDWRGLDEPQRARRREAFLAHDRGRGFDLRRAPLMRVSMFRCDGEGWEMVWTLHHILLDGRSMAPVLAEVFATYEAMMRGENPRIASRPEPFRDYIQRLAERNGQSSLAFFKELLRGKTVPTPLPLAEPATRPLPRQGAGEVRRWVDEPVRVAAQELARRTRTSMGTVLQAAWALVLSRLTGDLDVQFGSVRACRAGALGGEATRVVGLLMNTLPLRVRLDEDGSVADLLAQVRRQTLALRDHEHTPLFEIQSQGELPPGTALFETVLMFDNRELNQQLRELDPVWRSRPCTLHEQPSPPLTVTVFDAERLEIRVLFSRRRFREPVVERITSYLIAAIEGLARADADDEARLASVDIMPTDERRRVLFDWNDTARAFPDQLRIHEPFEQQVARQPEAVAVECRGARLTYAELEERANRLSHALIARGARPGVYIGVCLSRSLELVITLLAIAKSGAAYVPLDPDYPADRLAFMLADAKALLVITEQRYRGRFSTPAFVIDGGDEGQLAAMPGTRPRCAAGPTDVCYAIYTSGSTGQPKGVIVAHRAVVNTFDWVNRTFAVGPKDRLLFVTSPCFDLSVYDTFGALGAGATVVVATSEWLRDPQALAQAIVEQGITIWNSAPASMQRLAPFFPSAPTRDAEPSRLRLVMLSGDWIPIGLPGALKAAFLGVEVASLGGATEAAIWSNSFRVGDLDPRWTSIPYGRPIQNARYHVLDRRLRAVPAGVSGDLYIGGACLAEGYLDRPELTQERFIADPFGPPGERLYKTGDLARYFEDGNLEFLGRADFQVKIRGFRIELGEVEAALLALPEVREALCVPYDDASGQKSLAAYVVTRDGASSDEEAMKARLAATLPDFMLPSQIRLLAAMPVSCNGKIDRKALPSLTARTGNTPFVAPRSERERQMAAIWRDLLRKDQVSADDNFFALGGHSLLAVRLVSRVASELGATLPLASVLEHPTLEGMVASLEVAGSPRMRARHLVTLNRGGSRAPLVLVSGVGGLSFVFQGLGHSLGEQQPLHVLNAIGTQDASEGFDHTIERMAEIYEPQILAACPQDTIIVGGYSFGVLVAFEIARRLRLRGRTVPLLVSFDGFAPGYPELLPVAARVRSHVETFLNADAEGRREYVRGRIARLRTRLYGGIGRPEEAIPGLGVGDAETDRRLRKVAAGLTRARALYHPREPDPADLLLIKTGIFERWVGNRMDDPLYGWRSWVRGDIDVGVVPGAHLTMFHQANHARIAELVTEAVERCHTDGSS